MPNKSNLVKKVFKFGTGQEIPEGAIYLSTQVETISIYSHHENGIGIAHVQTKNELVWHYFLVEVNENE